MKKILLLTLSFILLSTSNLVSTNLYNAFKNELQTDTSIKSYREEIKKWHKQRISDLKKDFGWLSLIALDWLQEGSNEIKSVGTIELKNNVINVKMNPNIKAKIKDKSFESGTLKTDVMYGGPDRVEFGSKAFVIIKRGPKFAVRMWDSNAKARLDFKKINTFPISERWKIKAEWKQYSTAKKIKIASVIPGLVDEYDVTGIAIFKINGKEYSLEPVTTFGSKNLFFIFKDATNGNQTYGAGRFMYSEMPKDGIVYLDFNKAHNPPCAFSSFATCPLPPESNNLKVKIIAGEKKFGDH